MKSRLTFGLMSLEFRLRDLIDPPLRILQEAGARSGMNVLDFGCGPGSFTLAAARIVGPEGLIYAIDNDPLALESVRSSAAKRGFSNIRPIAGDWRTEVPEGAIDIVLLYDVLHEIREPAALLSELARILKPKGVLSVSDHHLKEPEISSRIAREGSFGFTAHGRRIFQFEKTERGEPAA